jgi:AcrR family transcriptional regulator
LSDTRKAPAKKPSKNREKLLAAARRLFAERGYAATGTEDIVREAGVTRGALYHQFADKQDLFRAMLEKMLPESSDRDDLKIGCRVLLGIYADPEVRRLFLIDGPAVLGLAGWKALQAPLSTLFLHHALQHLVDEGLLQPGEMEPVAELLAGALQQAGLGIANADDPQAARDRYAAGLDLIVDGLMRRG